MWNAGWGWLKAWRADARRPRRRAERRMDPAEMGVDFGLDACLESRLPPLMDMAAARAQTQGAAVLPLGTDQRSSLA